MAEAEANPGPQPDGRVRAVVEGITPSVDGGRFAAKRVVGDRVDVEADCFADGHDVLAARVLWRPEAEREWRETPMAPIGNDRWRGSFTVGTPGRYRYTVTAWVDGFLSWRHDFARRVDPEDIRVAALVGAGLVEATASRAAGADRARLLQTATILRRGGDPEALRGAGLDESLAALAERHPDRRFAYTFPVEFPLLVDRERARFSTWYEMFPRSASPEPGRHGTFRDCEARLSYVAAMGFDVLYLPPIHPIGREKRKGPNNTLVAAPSDIGSPWAIGAAEGGHKSILRELGTLEDFRRLVAAARDRGIEVALDIAFQCAPDHPYVAAHPGWFRRRPDGSVQYAENPPKKYQDIYPSRSSASTTRTPRRFRSGSGRLPR
jgi:starch synthase (maltosyl-transferring)